MKLNPKQFTEELFHASPNALKPRSIIKPDDWSRVAWAGDKSRADHHAEILTNGMYTHVRHGYVQQALFHPVYKVEPLKTDKTFEHTTSGQPVDQKTYRSQKGFRVKGFSHFAGGEPS